jgi:hypothetical protein
MLHKYSEMNLSHVKRDRLETLPAGTIVFNKKQSAKIKKHTYRSMPTVKVTEQPHRRNFTIVDTNFKQLVDVNKQAIPVKEHTTSMWNQVGMSPYIS